MIPQTTVKSRIRIKTLRRLSYSRRLKRPENLQTLEPFIIALGLLFYFAPLEALFWSPAKTKVISSGLMYLRKAALT